MRRLDIGIVSYGNPARFQTALAMVAANSATDWRCFVIHNPGGAGDDQARKTIEQFAAQESRFIPVWLTENVGYAGAVNKLFELAETEYIGYLDNDAIIRTQGWDELLCMKLDQYHEIGMVFPNGGPYPIQRDGYTEVMWGVGFCWVISRLAMRDVGPFDASLGHQDEADYALRVRMAGYRCAALPAVQVQHDATATNNPASLERISRGVVNWVNKWAAYFGGKTINYHSPNVIRWEDWQPNALYLEEYWKGKLPGLNANPEVIRLDGREYDLIKVPRLHGFYTNRII